MSTIYLIRHAHSVYTSDEIGRPLSLQGMKDARTVTDIMRTYEIDRVVSSPYKRAIQTVQGIADHIGIEVEIDNDFRERKLAGF